MKADGLEYQTDVSIRFHSSRLTTVAMATRHVRCLPGCVTLTVVAPGCMTVTVALARSECPTRFSARHW